MQTALSPDAQMELLRQRLAGNQVYARCRKASFTHMPLDDLLKEPSPTATLKAFRKWTADRSVILNMVTTLNRNGHTHASEELLESLLDDHVILGEGFPIEETYPAVFMMVEPAKTLLLARWLFTSQFKEDAIYWIENGCGNPERKLCGSLTPDFFEMFPHFKEYFLAQKYSPRVISPTDYFFETFFEKYLKKIEPFKDQWYSKDKPATDRHTIFIDPRRTGLWHSVYCVAAFVRGVTQKDILGPVFDREEQKNIVTWRFDLPKMVGDFESSFLGPNYWIGLHPEEEHEMWSKYYPSHVSRGVAHGLGAIVLSKTMMGEPYTMNSRKHVPPYEVLGRPYPNSITGDIKRQRLALSFYVKD